MISLSVSDVVGLAGVIVSFMTALVGMMFVYTTRRKNRYDEEHHRIELEAMRSSVEKQIYSLTEKLVATESRWRDVNHLLIASQARQPDANPTPRPNMSSEFFRAAGVLAEEIQVEPNLVFVLTPFHSEYQKEFDVIASVCRGLGLTAMRGDEEFVEGEVFPHILKLIARARLIIANVDGRNPNVFYELGIAHAMNKTTILVAPRPDDVPFDLRTKRLVLFESTEDLSTKLRDELARAAFVSAPA